MSVDADLLEKARAAAALLDEAERKVLLARAEYHTAIRRLHLAGGSLREIAEVLNVSHQRVQQMVNGAGGSWWSKVWRGRNVRRDAVCSFCGRPPSELAALIAGPDVYICDTCIGEGRKAAAEGLTSGAMRLAPEGDRTRCSFCNKGGGERRVVKAAAASICGECLGICQDILDNRKASQG